jgi:hypothetical protein
MRVKRVKNEKTRNNFLEEQVRKQSERQQYNLKNFDCSRIIRKRNLGYHQNK